MEVNGVTASGLVYLFGERFAKPVSRKGETLLYGGQTVDRKQLANKLFEAAFISLAEAGYISLAVEKRKWLFFTWKVVAVTRERDGDDLPGSLERAIMDKVSSSDEDLRVRAVVGWIIREISEDPWKWVIDFVMERLAESGVLERQVDEKKLWFLDWEKIHWSPNEEAIAPLAGEMETFKESRSTFVYTNRRLHQRLVKEVAAGIRGQEPRDVP